VAESLLLLFVVVAGAAAFYLLYERYYKKSVTHDQSQYVEALRNLLDGKHEAAFTKLRQVVAEDTSNIDAYLRLGQILRDHNRPDRALQVHKDLTLRFGLSKQDKISILQQLASDYIALNETQTAQAALKELVSLDPENHWAFTQRLRMEEKMQLWDEAYDTAAQLLKLESNKSKKPLARYKCSLADQLYKKREYHKSRVVYREAIGLDPTCVQAYLAVGDSYGEEERFEDAVNFWMKLITAVPEQAHLVIDRLKNTLFALGRFGDIVEICQTILEHSPKNLEARRALAEFHQKKGDLDAAAEALEQVLEDQPDDAVAALDLVRIYLEQGNHPKLMEFRRALERRREKLKTAAHARPPTTASAGR